MTRVVISQPMYFPWAGFIAQMALADVMIWLDDAQFSRGSFTNRVQVLLPGGRKWMSVPLEGKGHRKRIADLAAAGTGWRESHLAMLDTATKDRPHRAEALDCARGALARTPLCAALIASCADLAAHCDVIPPETLLSSRMDVGGAGWPRVLEIVQAAGGTSYVTGHGARAYLDHAAFERAGITVEYMDYAPVPWPQPDAFTPYVTALDLVASVEPALRRAHLNPRTRPWRDFLGAG